MVEMFEDGVHSLDTVLENDTFGNARPRSQATIEVESYFPIRGGVGNKGFNSLFQEGDPILGDFSRWEDLYGPASLRAPE